MGLRCGGGGEGCGDGPRLAPFRLGRARGGGRRLGGSVGSPACGCASPLSQRESACARRGCWAPAAVGGAAGAGAGAAGWAKVGAVAEAVLSRIQAVQMAWAPCWARFHLSTFAILQASCHRRISACSRLSACFAARAALRRVRAFPRPALLPLQYTG